MLGARRDVGHRGRAGVDHRAERDQRCQEPIDDGHRHDQRLLRVWQLEARERTLLLRQRAAIRRRGLRHRRDRAQGAVRARRIRSASGSGCGRCPARSSALLESKGKNTFGKDRDDTVVMPLRTFQRRLAGNEDIQQIQLSVRCVDVEREGAAGHLPLDARAPAPRRRRRRRLQHHGPAGDRQHDLRHDADADGAARARSPRSACSSAASGS